MGAPSQDEMGSSSKSSSNSTKTRRRGEGTLRDGQAGRHGVVRHMQSQDVEAAGPHVTEGHHADKASDLPKMPHVPVPALLEIQESFRRQCSMPMVPGLLGQNSALRGVRPRTLSPQTQQPVPMPDHGGQRVRVRQLVVQTLRQQRRRLLEPLPRWSAGGDSGRLARRRRHRQGKLETGDGEIATKAG